MTSVHCRHIIHNVWFYSLLACYLLHSMVSMDIRETGFSCGPGLSTAGWTIPKGDIILEYGQPLEIFCTLNMFQDITKGRNSSHLVFQRGKSLILSQYVTIVNETTVMLYIQSPEPSNDMYYCKLKLNDERIYNNSYVPTSLEASASSQMYEPTEVVVCLNSVAVGKKPGEVKNFTCISYNWERLVCTWTPPFSYIKTVYKVYYQTPGRSGRKILYPCPDDHDIRYNNCTWTLHSNPSYRRAFEYLYFTILGENTLGNVSTSIKFHHFAHLIPSPPDKLRIIDTTFSSVHLQWSIDFLIFFEKGFIYKIEYTWNSTHPWNVSIHNQKMLDKTNDEISLNVTGLPYPNVVYDFRVYMKSSVASGDNAWSLPAVITVKTKSCAPYMPPKTDVGSFEVSHLYPTYRDVYLYWQPLSKYDQNGDDFHYEVIAVEKDNNPISIESSIVTYSYAKFSNLRLSSYLFLVKSVNKEGYSSSSSQIFVPNSKDMIQEPLVFTKIDFGGGVYELSWKHPAVSKNLISNFTVFWCESNRERPYQCDGYIDWVNLPSNVNIYNVTVNSEKSYQFAIAVNSAHSSSGMVWASCTVLRDKVGKMKNVWVSKIGSDFIELGWKLECSDRVEGIQGYQIFYCPTVSPDNENCEEPEQKITVTGDASTVSGNITNLKPYTSYRISTAVFTKDGGPGPHSDYLFNHTLDGAPDVDGICVTVLDVTNVSVTLSWNPPKTMNGIFQYYEVRYNENMLRIKNDTKVTLSKLKSYTDYNITVFACTKLCSLVDSIIHIKTKIGIPSTVLSLTAHKINSSFALVKWNPPLIKSGPHNTYNIMVQVDNFDQNFTVYEFTTNRTEVEVSVPDCKHENLRLSYTFYVRAENIDYSATPDEPVSYIGDWSPAYSINCIRSNLSFLLKLIIFFLIFVTFVILFFVGKLGMYRCKKMKEVQVTLPPNFTRPPLFDTMKDSEYQMNSENWKNKNAELDHLNTRLSETDCEDEIENTVLDEIDEKDRDLDTDPYSSGCCSGRISSTSSMIGGTQTSDSGTEMEPKSIHINLLCDMQPPTQQQDMYSNFLSAEEVGKCLFKQPLYVSPEDSTLSWMDGNLSNADDDEDDDRDNTTRISPGYVLLHRGIASTDFLGGCQLQNLPTVLNDLPTNNSPNVTSNQ